MAGDFKYVVVGAGLSGAVMAERIAAGLGERVLVVERRAAPGGNARSEIDPETGIERHVYGSHIFHTSDERAWEYANRFVSFTNYRHKVLIRTGGKTYSMPINLKTLCDFHGRSLSPAEARELLARDRAAFAGEPANLEEKAISLVGRDLYEAFIRGYTAKQWGRDPRTLPADIITRLPVRTTFNDDYFGDPHQGVPREGYFTLFERLLAHPNVIVRCGTEWADVAAEIPSDAFVYHTGMIDEFCGYAHGPLEWRSLRFAWETLDVDDFQGTAVVNDGNPDVPWTRIHEFKHYHPERKVPYESGRTVICREYPHGWEPGEEAYYPVNSEPNRERFARYRALAAERAPNVEFGGRLGCYRYWDMDKAISASLAAFDALVARVRA